MNESNFDAYIRDSDKNFNDMIKIILDNGYKIHYLYDTLQKAENVFANTSNTYFNKYAKVCFKKF